MRQEGFARVLYKFVEKAALADRVGGMLIIGFDGTAIQTAPVN